MSLDLSSHTVEQLMDIDWSHDGAEEVATDPCTAVACEFLTSTIKQAQSNKHNQA